MSNKIGGLILYKEDSKEKRQAIEVFNDHTQNMMINNQYFTGIEFGSGKSLDFLAKNAWFFVGEQSGIFVWFDEYDNPYSWGLLREQWFGKHNVAYPYRFFSNTNEIKFETDRRNHLKDVLNIFSSCGLPIINTDNKYWNTSELWRRMGYTNILRELFGNDREARFYSLGLNDKLHKEDVSRLWSCQEFSLIYSKKTFPQTGSTVYGGTSYQRGDMILFEGNKELGKVFNEDSQLAALTDHTLFYKIYEKRIGIQFYVGSMYTLLKERNDLCFVSEFVKGMEVNNVRS